MEANKRDRAPEADGAPQPIVTALEAALVSLAAAVRERERAPMVRAHKARRQRATSARARCWWLESEDV